MGLQENEREKERVGGLSMFLLVTFQPVLFLPVLSLSLSCLAYDLHGLVCFSGKTIIALLTVLTFCSILSFFSCCFQYLLFFPFLSFLSVSLASTHLLVSSAIEKLMEREGV